MVDMRNNLAKEVSEELEKHFPSLVFNTLIPRNTKESYPVIIDGNTSFRKQEHNIAETAILTAFIPLKKTGIFSMRKFQVTAYTIWTSLTAGFSYKRSFPNGDDWTPNALTEYDRFAPIVRFSWLETNLKSQ